jgi:hypothetical protein
MSVARRRRRENSRQTQKHLHVLSELLMEFYEFLENKEKPTDEQLRTEFISRENRWKHYCSTNKLTEKASLLFNQEVAQSWNNRYAKQSLTLN